MSADNERRIWPGGYTTEEVRALIREGYYAEKRRMEEAAAKRKAKEQARTEKVVEFPPKLSAQELWRRQQVVDAHWEAMLREKAELAREAEARSFHRGPGDPDWRA
jgi:hypothetical protein